MLQDVVEEYLSVLANRENERGAGSRNTSMAYRNDLNQFCTYLSGQGLEEWSQVSREVVASYLLQLREGFAYRPTTIARKLAALKSFFRYIREEINLITDDPVAGLDTPRIQKELPQVLTPEQVTRLFEQIDVYTPAGIRDMAMLHMLYATGMRASELVSLNVDDLHPAEATIVCPGRNSNRSNKRVRELPLPEAALEAIIRYLKHVRPHLVRGTKEQKALFLNHHGQRLTRQGFWLIIKGYAHQIGVEHITPHMLRHSFAIVMLKEGKDLSTVQALMGHAHISTTQIYNQLVNHQRTNEDTSPSPQDE